jgi:hypothetical protein
MPRVVIDQALNSTTGSKLKRKSVEPKKKRSMKRLKSRSRLATRPPTSLSLKGKPHTKRKQSLTGRLRLTFPISFRTARYADEPRR